jgi:hypothetical protein
MFRHRRRKTRCSSSDKKRDNSGPSGWATYYSTEAGFGPWFAHWEDSPSQLVDMDTERVTVIGRRSTLAEQQEAFRSYSHGVADRLAADLAYDLAQWVFATPIAVGDALVNPTWGNVAIAVISVGVPGGGLVGRAARGAAQLGRAGEAAAGIIKNSERIASATGSAAYRVPDVLNHSGRIIGEVKNVGSLSYTNQLRDFAAYASKNGYSFQLWVRPTTQLSGPLQQAVANGEIVLRFLP